MKPKKTRHRTSHGFGEGAMDTPPPPQNRDDPEHPVPSKLYSDIDPLVPDPELKDTYNRKFPII